MSEVIAYIISNYFVTTVVIGFICSGVSLMKKPKPLSKNIIVEAFFSYYLLWGIGISNLLNFMFHVFFGDMAAQFSGWAQSPYQAEVGFASLGIGIAGILAYKAVLPFRFAAILAPTVFGYGAAGGHIYQMITAHNFSPGNMGLVMPSGFIIPTLALVFVWLSYKYPMTNASYTKLR